MCEMEKCIFFKAIDHFVLYISFCQSIRICHRGIQLAPSINWVAAKLRLNTFTYVHTEKPDQRREKKLMENTHSATNNRLFSPFPLAPFLYSNHLKGKTAKTAPSRACRATAAGTRRPPHTAPRCCQTTPPQRHQPPTSQTPLGRKSQIHSKSGPSPGACMKADVSMKQV